MRHSLYHRWQGGLLGSLLGEMAANPQSQAGKPGLATPLAPEMQVAFSLLTPLIQSGQVSAADWQQIPRQQKVPLAGAGSGELAVMTLPLALFFHDSPCRFQEQIQAACQVGQIPAAVMADVLLWGRGIALALREKLRPGYFCEQLLAGEPTSPTLLREQLQQIQPCLARGLPLAQAISRLSRQQPSSGGELLSPLAAALYCFSQTPEDFGLCVLRAARSGPQTHLKGALAGALAGAYNSFTGLPSHWRLAIQKQPTAQQVTKQTPALFAAWLGHYNPQSFILQSDLAAASPNVIQPRPSLQIISQQLKFQTGGERFSKVSKKQGISCH
jgi:hypothetical protein